MAEDVILQVLKQGLYLALLVSLPVVLTSLAVGLFVSLIQATTQLQDHTLSFVPKLVAVLGALALFGGWMGGQLLRFTQSVFMGIAMWR
ncbi:MAG: flagellar biosynthesis protein FliQ [Deltaproteobacteria bacterium]|nr:flagellar biosynthesis protein FliQ [Deltaproteobacteria bacterium]